MSAIPRESQDYTAPAFFERTIDLSRINFDIVLFTGLVLLSVVAHLWGLGHMAMHHDESIHAWTSWRFYTGAGSFTCASGRVASTYCYDPVYHGPALYMFTLLSYFLFGDGELQARLPEALAGIGLVASAWMLRPYLGRRGAFIAGVLLAFAPTLLYFTRFARHDGLMLLWTFWIVIGFFRYLDTAQPRYLYLLAIGAGLAMTTHELYYILFFLFGAFLLIRLLFETQPRRRLSLGLAAILAVACVLIITDPPITDKLYAGGLALLVAVIVGMGLLMIRVWEEAPILLPRARLLWYEQRRELWIAVGILAAIFVLFYSTFFADPRGIIDGLYQGLSYWLGSQHAYQRADQPWYYYLMVLPLYEPLALFGGIGAAIFLFTRPALRSWGFAGVAQPKQPAVVDTADLVEQDGTTVAAEANGALADEGLAEASNGTGREALIAPAVAQPAAPAIALFPLFLAFWFIGALVAFSWAGEKMPWLSIHIALPGNLLVAWALGRLLDSVEWRALPDRRAALIPPALVLLLIAFSVAMWRLGSPGEGQQGQAALLQGLIPLAIMGALIYGILTIGQAIGSRMTLTLCALTIAVLLGAYMIRATWMAVYDHPDTPRELLVYTQTSPDVPLISADLHMLAINQTRNTRSADDPIGGHSMPVIMDTGDSNGDGSLAWPFQWYLRDFQRIENRQADFFRNATADSFQVAVDSKQPNGEKEFAPAVLVYVPHMTDATRQSLAANYVERYDSKLNWWFPEGNECAPDSPGYKRFYFNSWTPLSSLTAPLPSRRPTGCSPDIAAKLAAPWAPLVWPLSPENWPTLKDYLLYRELPPPLRLDGREMQMWVRKDLTSTGSTQESAGGVGSLKLVAQQAIGAPGKDPGQLDQPRGIAVDQQGNVYVADTGSHRIEVFKNDGTPLRTIGTFGSAAGQFNEPHGVAVDAQGNLYVADTWNARIAKFDATGTFVKSWGEGKQEFGEGRRATMTDGTEAGNATEPLGFFGPRGIAVDKQGNVYIADTGNKRIVVTDGNGTFLYQWGHAGSEPGAFNEPVGIAVDGQGSVYVADTWNGRVQVFGRDRDGKVSPIPTVTWQVAGWQPNTYDDPFVAVSAGGQVFVTVPSRDSVIYANTRGDVLLRWGGKGTDMASLTLPSGAAVGPDDSVYIVDHSNGRVLRFMLPKIESSTPTG